MTSSRHLTLGLFVLLLVDVIWVASSELSEYVFKDTGFNKPFFSTYFKTSLFSIYLLGFLFWPPWRKQCCQQQPNLQYSRLRNSSSEEGVQEGQEDNVSDDGDNPRLSSPQFEPVKIPGSDKNSDAEEETASGRSVRFSRVAEVRQLPDADGAEALLSRLSFSASLRAQQELYNLHIGLAVSAVAYVALVFCLLWFLGNYSYQMALSISHSGIINVVSSTSGLFTLILAAVFPSASGDAFTVSKLLTVLLMLAGVMMVSLEDYHQHGASVPPAADAPQQPLYHLHRHHRALNSSFLPSASPPLLGEYTEDPFTLGTTTGTVGSLQALLSAGDTNASSSATPPIGRGDMSGGTGGGDDILIDGGGGIGVDEGSGIGDGESGGGDGGSGGGIAGVWWGLCGAVVYACYMVFIRRTVKRQEDLNFTMFFGE
ncbi:solute carrier family 35 member F5 [Hyalella azteca]|uniref:Solute carrier family 35 member F5 n=1 Tax=Hyalella azteca TaxID=294128 RepID=A0A8B7NK21_HYAAZ|nr:solute carrier family 35 member F5 [Hyalella azteca]